MLEIIANNIALDLPEDIKVASTFEFFDIGDIKTFKGSYSKTANIPKTPNNCKALGFPDQINTNEVIANITMSSGAISSVDTEVHAPHAKIPTVVKEDGIELIPNGFLIITSVTDNISVVIYSGSKEFSDIIKNKTLRDIDLSDLYQELNSANILGSSIGSSIGTKDYIYPLVDWGVDLLLSGTNGDPTVDMTYLYPAVYAKYLFEKIITDANYTLDPNISFPDIFDNIVIPPVSRISKNPDWATDRDLYVKNCELGLTDDQNYTSGFYAFINLNDGVYDPSDCQQLDPLWGTAYGIRIKHTRELYVTARLLIKNNHLTDTLYVGIVGVDADGDNGYDIADFSISPGDTLDTVYNIDFNEIPYLLLTGYVLISLATGDELKTLNATVYSADTKLCTHFSEMTFYKHYFPLETNMPKIKQSEFLKAMSYILGLVIIIDDVSKVVQMIGYDELYEAIRLGNVDDWSDKLNLSKEPKLEFAPKDYGKRNLFKYKEFDKDVITTEQETTYYFEQGNSFFDIVIADLEDEKTVVELDLYPCPLRNEISGYSTAWIPSSNLTQESKNHILVINATIVSGDFIYEDDYSGGGTYADITHAFSHFKDVNASQNLDFATIISDRYPYLIKILSRFTKVTAYFNLSASDINAIDVRRPVFVQYFQAFFYINRVVDYVSGQPTKVELIKLNM